MNEMPSRHTSHGIAPMRDPEGSASRVVLPANALESFDFAAVGGGGEEYRPPVVRPRSILGDAADLLPALPSVDPGAAERASLDTRVYTPSGAGLNTAESDDFAGMFSARAGTASFSASRHAASEPVRYLDDDMDVPPAAPQVQVIDYDFDGRGRVSGARVGDPAGLAEEQRRIDSETSKIGRREAAKRAKEEARRQREQEALERKQHDEAARREASEEKARRAAEAAARRDEEERRRVLAQNASENAKASERGAKDEARQAARDAKDVKRRAKVESREAAKRAARDAKDVKRRAKAKQDADAREESSRREQIASAARSAAEAAAPAPADVPVEQSESKRPSARADAAAERKRARADAAARRAQERQQREVDQQRYAEAIAVASEHARRHRREDAARASADAERVRAGVRAMAEERKRRERERKDHAIASKRGADTRSVHGPDRPVRGGRRAAKAATQTASPRRHEQPASLAFIAEAEMASTATLTAPPVFERVTQVSVPAVPTVPTPGGALTAPDRVPARDAVDTKRERSRRERRRPMEDVEQPEKVVSDADRARALRERSEQITNAQIAQVKQNYRESLDAVRAAAKAREIEMGDEGVTLADGERKGIKRAAVGVAAGVGVAAFAGGLAFGALQSDGIATVVSSVTGDGGTEVAPTVVSVVEGSSGEFVKIARAFASEECGAAVVLSVLGSDVAGASATPFDLSSLSFTINGQPVVMSESTETCYSDTTVYPGVGSNYVIFFDSDATEVTSVTAALGEQEVQWQAPVQGAVPADEA